MLLLILFNKGFLLKYFTILVFIFLLMGCTHREYANIHGLSANYIEQDEAQCTLEAEKSLTSTSSERAIIINTGAKLSKQERKELEEEQYRKESNAESIRNSKVRKLRDLCLKTKGWSWKDVDD